MHARVQLVSIIGAAVLLVVVLELVRRRRLMERYALLWVLSAAVLLALAIWQSALGKISHAIGVYYPPNALFLIAIGCIVLLLLHFSYVVSRLGEQSETLAQRQALIEHAVDCLHEESRRTNGAASNERAAEGAGPRSRRIKEDQASARQRIR